MRELPREHYCCRCCCSCCYAGHWWSNSWYWTSLSVLSAVSHVWTRSLLVLLLHLPFLPLAACSNHGCRRWPILWVLSWNILAVVCEIRRVVRQQGRGSLNYVSTMWMGRCLIHWVFAAVDVPGAVGTSELQPDLDSCMQNWHLECFVIGIFSSHATLQEKSAIDEWEALWIETLCEKYGVPFVKP